MANSALVDFHMHTRYSPDSEASMPSMCEAAVQNGVQAIAITDHVEVDMFLQDGYDKTLAASFREAKEMQKQFEKKIRISCGVELGEPMHDLETAQAILDTYSFDFVLGSLHNLKDDKDFYHYDFTDADIPSLMDKYFAEELDMARWGHFHSLAHLTYPFRYFPEKRRPADYSRWQKTIDEILKTIADKDIALEINTSGLRQTIGKTLPDYEIVRRFRELGGEKITLGSDSHRPEDVAKNIVDGIKVAQKAGFQYITTYYKGRPEMLPIEPSLCKA